MPAGRIASLTDSAMWVTKRFLTIAHPPDKKRRLEKRERKRRQAVEDAGAGLFSNFFNGGQHKHEPNNVDEQQSSIIHLPHVDDKANSINRESGAEQPTINGEVNEVGNASNAENKGCAVDKNGAMNRSADNPASIPAAKSHDESLNGSGSNQPTKANPANGTGERENDFSENEQSQDTLTSEEQARLHSLKAMLDASNARYQKATRNRRPKFTAGLQILIISGDHTGKTGVVLDADYIANRALVSLSDQESPHWIAFQFLGHAD